RRARSSVASAASGSQRRSIASRRKSSSKASAVSCSPRASAILASSPRAKRLAAPAARGATPSLSARCARAPSASPSAALPARPRRPFRRLLGGAEPQPRPAVGAEPRIDDERQPIAQEPHGVPRLALLDEEKPLEHLAGALLLGLFRAGIVLLGAFEERPRLV